MAISWKLPQRTAVANILDAPENRPSSGRCREVAEAILPYARVRDPRARLVEIRPRGRARFVLPTVKLDRPWYHHVTTEVAAHHVDCLTGVDGTSIRQYMLEHWLHPEWLEITPR